MCGARRPDARVEPAGVCVWRSKTRDVCGEDRVCVAQGMSAVAQSLELSREWRGWVGEWWVNGGTRFFLWRLYQWKRRIVGFFVIASITS